MNNLIAYIPVLNRQYLEWLESYAQFHFFLVSQELVKSLIPRLERNMVAVPTKDIFRLILGIRNKLQESIVNIFNPEVNYQYKKLWIMPDEDISHAVAEKYLFPVGCKVEFEQIWARWDMTAVKRQEPVIPDLEVSSKEIDVIRMKMAKELGQKSPDWWRQIGAMAWKDGEIIACAFNQHYPTEYETFIFGDPRINFDAGDPVGAKIYLSLHAEEGIVTTCAREGVALKGASVYVTTFPCGDCARMLADCQIKDLFFSEGYSVLKGFETLKATGVRIVKVNPLSL